jgi:hypothetical protein
MKEMTSNHDDMDKRLAIFFGLGAFILSALVGLVRNYTLEAFLLQGVVVLGLATVVGYLFGLWLRNALASVEPKEERPDNVEVRRTNADALSEGTVVVPDDSSTVISEDGTATTGSVVNYTLPELDPNDLAGGPAPQSAPAPVEQGDLPPPSVPAWLK